jgi:tetratricopeptide (TPR) repeat protein
MTCKFYFAIPLIAINLLPLPVIAQQADANAEAGVHFERGVVAFEQKRFGDASKEFREAYRLSPAFAVLYNIAQVSVALGDSVGAVDAFEKYLEQGANNIDEQRRQSVMAELAKQRAIIGFVAVRSNPEGVEIRIDGKLIGKTPLPNHQRVSPGRHSIVAILDGYEAQAREMDVAPGALVELNLNLLSSGNLQTSTTSPGKNPVPESRSPSESGQRTTINVAVNQADRSTPVGSGQRTAAYILGGLGVGLIGVGTYFAISGASMASDAKNRINDAQTGKEWDLAKADFDDAKSRNQVALVGVGVGTAMLAGGVIVFLTAPKTESKSSLAIAPFVTANATGLLARTSW